MREFWLDSMNKVLGYEVGSSDPLAPEEGYDEAFKAAGMEHYALHGTIAYRQYFLNGYGVSIVCGRGTIGYDTGLWELAVLHREPNARSFTMCYTSDITHDVIGYLSVAEALALVARIQALDITGKEVTV